MESCLICSELGLHSKATSLHLIFARVTCNFCIQSVGAVKYVVIRLLKFREQVSHAWVPIMPDSLDSMFQFIHSGQMEPPWIKVHYTTLIRQKSDRIDWLCQSRWCSGNQRKLMRIPSRYFTPNRECWQIEKNWHNWIQTMLCAHCGKVYSLTKACVLRSHGKPIQQLY